MAMHIDRRTVLRGALFGGGLAAVPLPRLGAMLNNNGTAYAATNQTLRRFGVWFVGNGFVPDAFTPNPRATGPLATLSPILSPLEKLKAKITVVSGFDLKTGRPDGLPHGHFFGGLSGAHGNPAGKTFQLPTIDQIIADGPLGGGERKSLQLGVCDGTGGIGAQAYKALSSRGPNAQNVFAFDPMQLFNDLFKSGGAKPPAPTGTPATGPAMDPTFARDKSILDSIRADASALEVRLGREDRVRLQSHMAGLRALEDRLFKMSMTDPTKQPAAAICGKTLNVMGADLRAEINPAVAAAQSDVLVLALACDKTRVFFYQLSRPAANIVYPWLKDVSAKNETKPKDFHGINHRYTEDLNVAGGGTITGRDAAIKGATATIGLYADLLAKMDAVDEGNGTLLDNSSVMISSCVSWGKTHTQWEWPCVIGGRGGVRLDDAGKPDPSGRFNFKGAWHHRSDNSDNFSRVLLTLANLNEAKQKSIGKDGGFTDQVLPAICGPTS
jgi:hypothetical protein